MKTHPHYWLMSRPMHGSATALRRQHGAFLITFALFMLFLLGFMGIALDFGRLFVVKTELQTAVDSCALAAARELNGQDDAIDRARSAGMEAGNSNNANLQSASWNGQGKLTATDTYIRFRKQDYLTSTSDGKLARYAECQYSMNSIKLWLLQAMGAFTGDSVNWPNTGTVGARAVATRASAQTACPIPVKLIPGTKSTPDGQGYDRGDWVLGLSNDAGGNNFGWANLSGNSNSANETKKEMQGYCGNPENITNANTSGVQGLDELWNARFGIYRQNATSERPDYTGYIYTYKNWKDPDGGSTPRAAYKDFIKRRLVFAPCGNNINECENRANNNSNVPYDLKGGFKDVLTSSELQSAGADRRIVTMPVVKSSSDSRVTGFACMLMLQPMMKDKGKDNSDDQGCGKGSKDGVCLEYLGNANDPTSPCTSNGLAGGSNGPLVPVLVR